jgi:aspartyl/asparaginyl beta-hydroxylase (cupin superfamily)
MIREIEHGRQADSAFVTSSKEHLRNLCIVLRVRLWGRLRDMKPGRKEISAFVLSKENLLEKRVVEFLIPVHLGPHLLRLQQRWRQNRYGLLQICSQNSGKDQENQLNVWAIGPP